MNNVVLIQSVASRDGTPYAFCDLFRDENGKIIELRAIPGEMACENGIF